MKGKGGFLGAKLDHIFSLPKKTFKSPKSLVIYFVFQFQIVPLFYSCGEIHSARLMMDFSGVNRGFAYIRYMTVDGANNAIRKMNSYEIRVGRKIKVTKSVDNCRLFIGRIDKTLTKEEIQEKLESLTDGVKDASILLVCLSTN